VSEFVDKAQIHVKAGDGGAGCVSFRREAHIPKGGPDGGNGAKGGDVYLQANENIKSLKAFKDQPFRKAQNGGHGSSQKKHGKSGKDLIVFVPVGTVIKDLNGNVLGELVKNNQRMLVARGGRGGWGNARLATPTNKLPNFAEQGEYGEDLWLNLELKLVADVGLVGFPNAGKSTLISAITNKKAKTAPYAFTTIYPNLGVISNDEGLNITVADIPGVIEGASCGKGLGFEFLRHIERVKAIIYVLDLSLKDPDSLTQLKILHSELSSYSNSLVKKPSLVVGNKVDLVNFKQNSFCDVVISALYGYNLNSLKQRIFELVKVINQDDLQSSQPVLHRPEPRGIKVEIKGYEFHVLGKDALRAVNFNDVTSKEALQIIQKRLKRLGLDKHLIAAGAKKGATVVIGDLVFQWEPD